MILIFLGYNGSSKVTMRTFVNKKNGFSKQKPCRARAVTENPYGMLKGRCQLIYKKYELQLKNIKHIIMTTFFPPQSVHLYELPLKTKMKTFC